MKEIKVFGIGFHKTGTTTLELVLKKLGYKVLGCKVSLAQKLFDKQYDDVLSLTEDFDALQDNPWPLLYKELDQKYPNSKFILTIRDEQKWISSVVNHFGKNHTDMREWIYGVGFPEGNEDIFLKRYKKHNQEVLKYFKNRHEDLLVVNWESGDSWNEICNFLNETIPNRPFPHANKGTKYANDRLKVNKVGYKVKRILKKLLS